MSIRLAEQFEANEQYEQALNEYKNELVSSPDDLGILERLGHISLILENYDEAAYYYNEILHRDVTNALAYDQLISIYESRDKYKYYICRGNKNSLEGKLEFAINDFKKAVAASTDGVQTAMTRLTLANLYRQAGKVEKAIDEFNMLLDGDDLNETMFLQLAEIYVQDEAYPSAIDTLHRAKNKGFDSDAVNEALAFVYLKAGNPEKALEYTKDELLIIQCLLESGRGQEAFEKLNNISDELKKAPKYLILMAQYYYTNKDFAKALEFIDSYNNVVPNSPLTYQMRALVYDEKGDEYNSYVNWGRYHILRKDYDMATHEFLNAVQIKADDVDLMFDLAKLLIENGEIDHASEYYERILRIDPSNREALFKLSQYKEGLGDYKGQVQCLESANEVAPNDTEILKALGSAYEKNRQGAKALETYKKFESLSTNPNELQLIKDKINKLEGSASDTEESEGLIDKIMKIFGK